MAYMVAQDGRLRLANLLVEGLELGSGKFEVDVGNELFAAFGLDLNEIDRSVAASTRDRASVLREQAANALAAAVPSTAALLNALVRVGGRFVLMVEEIYELLAHCAVSTAGTNEVFTISRGELDEDGLSISPAFVEQVRHVESRLVSQTTGRADIRRLNSLVGLDNGVPYGSWPLEGDKSKRKRFRLTAAVLQVPRMAELWARRAREDGGWLAAAAAGKEATRASEVFIAAAERVVAAHAAHLDFLLAEVGEVDAIVSAAYGHDLKDWELRAVSDEVERFQRDGLLASVAVENQIEGLKEMSCVGLRDGKPTAIPTAEFGGGGVSDLACVCAMYRLGLRPRDDREIQDVQTPLDALAWATRLQNGCLEVASWLDRQAIEVTGQVDNETLVEWVEELLNLPLWRQRSLLYEVWLLIATLRACEADGWRIALSGLKRRGEIWHLSISPLPDPVAELSRSHPDITLEVWREPRREAVGGGVLTPDVTISSAGTYARDLIVVEAKDRVKMLSGVNSTSAPARQSTRAVPSLPEHSALGVATTYARKLRPTLTWVCNHVDFRGHVEAGQNHGDPWTSVHVADRFRPGNVPSAFAATCAAALRPMHITTPEPTAASSLSEAVAHVTLVVDATHSSEQAWTEAARCLRRASAMRRVCVVLYTDHQYDEPFLALPLGPFTTADDLIAAVSAVTRGHDDGFGAALEDALRCCRDIAANVGPHTVLIIADNAPRSPEQCPAGIDATEEVAHLIELECEVWLANDWLNEPAREWIRALDMPIRLAPLSDLLA